MWGMLCGGQCLLFWVWLVVAAGIGEGASAALVAEASAREEGWARQRQRCALRGFAVWMESVYRVWRARRRR